MVANVYLAYLQAMQWILWTKVGKELMAKLKKKDDKIIWFGKDSWALFEDNKRKKDLQELVIYS